MSAGFGIRSSGCEQKQGCHMVCFKKNLGNFAGPLNGKCWYIL
jgi:hypothetical protein